MCFQFINLLRQRTRNYREPFNFIISCVGRMAESDYGCKSKSLTTIISDYECFKRKRNQYFTCLFIIQGLVQQQGLEIRIFCVARTKRLLFGGKRYGFFTWMEFVQSTSFDEIKGSYTLEIFRGSDLRFVLKIVDLVLSKLKKSDFSEIDLSYFA